MAQTEQQVDLLLRRRIEAQVLLPLIRAFEKRLGREETRKIVSDTLKEISRKDGNAKAESLGGNSLEGLAAGVIPMWQGGGHLELEMKESTDDVLRFDVTRCDYVALYEELGMGDLTEVLSCGRDWAFLEGFNPGLELLRDQTLAAGDRVCNFCYRKKHAL
ncbi:MAG TPA: L-2-amino-thiazoline-4-carboxylic acid hydrolase [Deltaproteobacteria bacterium]|nr:L-2-amino-thiazoline-4-carboxylic acid hydrolase [Deltaproteobacteria bacterium]